jgi:CBS-domain-containing membrane protein
MHTKYEPIATLPLPASTLTTPKGIPEVIHVDDPALENMYDFSCYNPLMLLPTDSITDAEMVMKVTDLRIIFIVDHLKNVLGILSSEELQGTKPYQIMQDRRIKRSEILCKSIMTPCEQILAFDIAELQHVKVGHIMTTLQEAKKHFALVIDVDNLGNTTIIGLFSFTQICKSMGIELTDNITEAHSIVELQHKLNNT